MMTDTQFEAKVQEVAKALEGLNYFEWTKIEKAVNNFWRSKFRDVQKNQSVNANGVFLEFLTNHDYKRAVQMSKEM